LQTIREYALERLAAGQGQPTRAALLLGAAKSMLIGGSAPHIEPAWRFAREQIVAALRTQLGDATFDAAWAAGQALTLEQAITEALNR
jgi:hypothetical protein